LLFSSSPWWRLIPWISTSNMSFSSKRDYRQSRRLDSYIRLSMKSFRTFSSRKERMIGSLIHHFCQLTRSTMLTVFSRISMYWAIRRKVKLPSLKRRIATNSESIKSKSRSPPNSEINSAKLRRTQVKCSESSINSTNYSSDHTFEVLLRSINQICLKKFKRRSPNSGRSSWRNTWTPRHSYSARYDESKITKFPKNNIKTMPFLTFLFC